MNKLDRRVSLLLVGALTIGAGTACLNNKDIVEVTGVAPCWRYPGGKNMKGQLAPYGQQSLATYEVGTILTVEQGDVLGATVGRYTRVVNKNELACWIDEDLVEIVK